jgi:predicted ATP-grasp superfamily ATP-dependent carboligase
MHIFLYEWITGGGLVDDAGRLPASLLAEGSAMITALAADFAAIEGSVVTVLRDARLTDLPLNGCKVIEVHASIDRRAEFDRLAATADGTLVVAPEFDGILRATVAQARVATGRSLNASDEFIALTSDKHRTAEHLRAAGIAAPIGRVLEADEEKLPPDFPYPGVLKPLDGAGSQHTLLVYGSGDEPAPYPWPRRLEQFCPGRAASVAVLCGQSRYYPLPPCWQNLSVDGRFTYRGGSTISETDLRERATTLALEALAALPPANGYIGVDLALGAAIDGSEDVVIEVNPRLTTSYVGLRAAVQQNLAQAMLRAASGGDVQITQREAVVEFSADGTVRCIASSRA